MMFPLLGTIFYVGLLIVNAMAVLSEERFLAPSTARFVCFSFTISNNTHKLAGHPPSHKTLASINTTRMDSVASKETSE